MLKGIPITRVTIIATVIESISLLVMLLTTGHAGPEGRFTLLGWLGTLINLPGFAITGALMPSSIDSFFIRLACAFVIQTLLLTCLI